MFSHLILSSSSLSTPPIIRLIDLKKERKKESFSISSSLLLFESETLKEKEKRDKEKNHFLSPPILVTTAIEEENTVLYSHVYMPFSESSQNGYPTVVVIYGGPHVARVKNEWLSTVRNKRNNSYDTNNTYTKGGYTMPNFAKERVLSDKDGQ